jgi:hypothetical protein
MHATFVGGHGLWLQRGGITPLPQQKPPMAATPALQSSALQQYFGGKVGGWFVSHVASGGVPDA